jgi:hypothetical protein
LNALHHAALFACTRWTNFYFPTLAGFFGDPVGGPMSPWFGRGVRDIPLRSGNLWMDRTVLAHTAYWDKRLHKSVQPLIDALDLKNTKYYE